MIKDMKKENKRKSGTEPMELEGKSGDRERGRMWKKGKG